MKKTTILIAIGLAAVCLFAVESVQAQTQYIVQRVPVIEEIPVTGYRKVVETHYVEEKITTYETVWETEKRVRNYTVARQVPETSLIERKYTVQKPVDVIEYKDTSYDIIRTVPEVSMREERYLVPKQVMETQERQVYETRRIPVQETTMEQKVYTVNRPVTNYVETVVDKGQFVNQVNTLPGQTYNRLTWHRANYIDPVSGDSKWRVPGFFFTEMQGPERHEVNRVYQPNYVAQTVPVTKMIPEQRIEEFPVTRTTYREEQIVRSEPYQVSRIEQVEMVREIPVTTYKQIVERVEQKTPYTVRRMVPEEVIEMVPTTEYKTIMENKSEPYEVRVAKVVPVTRTVPKPVTTVRWEPYTYVMERPKMELRRVEVSPTSSSSVPSSAVDKPVSADPADRVPTLPR